MILGLIFDIDVSNHVFSDVISDDDFFEFAELCKLSENFLIKVFKVVYGLNQTLLWHIQPIRKGYGCRWVIIEVRKHHGLGDGWLIVNTCAGLPMTAGSNLEIEGTVHLVLLCTENFRQTFCH